jgi:hypothetical protein
MGFLFNEQVEVSTQNFDLSYYLDRLRDSNSGICIRDYEEMFGKISNDILKEEWYLEISAKYPLLKKDLLNVPEELKDSCNWDLFMQFMAASMISKYTLEIDENQKINCNIRIENETGEIMFQKDLHKIKLENIDFLLQFYIGEAIGFYIYNQSDMDVVIEKVGKLFEWKKLLNDINEKLKI